MFPKFGRYAWLALLFAMPALAAASHQAGDIVIEHGTAQSGAGVDVPYEIGTLYVAENRQRPATASL
jgi:hypothetical protein